MRRFILLLTVSMLYGSLCADPGPLDVLKEKIEAARPNSSHPAFQHHLDSTLAICQKAWTETEQDAEAFGKTKEFIGNIIKGFDFDAGNPAVYLSESKRSLIIGFMSEAAGDLQFYACKLPADWNPEKAYPLVVNLHGRGPDHLLSYVHIHFGTPGNLEEYNNKKSGPTDHILIFPWGRGNAGYTNPVVESDVLQCVRDVKSRFKVDESRQYLQGHSMGGFGSWYLGGKYADRWAAVIIQEGGYSSGLAPYAEQLSRLPVRLWSGDADEVIPPRFLYKMQGALEAFGGKPDIVLVPGWGHKPPDTEQNRKNLEWLLQHKKEKP
jgi:pimeloyl-ACP methyl ester carboxylesterase